MRGSQTPIPIWSDGIHFVRAASKMDDHPLRWVIGAHRSTASKLSRHAATMDEAIKAAIRGTENWIRNHPDDAAHFTPALLPKSSELSGPKKGVRPPKAKLPDFSTYHFHCIRANPIAQVWQCISLPGEKAAVGRKAAGNRTPKQTAFNHTKGECAVMVFRDPVREPDGQVRVFPTWGLAEEFAMDLYNNADEEERLAWVEDGKVVGRTLNVDIIFDPAVNGAARPFSLWLPKWNKPVYEGARKARYQPGASKFTGNPDMAAAAALARKLADMDDEAPKRLSLNPQRFDSIWGAEDHALNITERVLRGERVAV